LVGSFGVFVVAKRFEARNHFRKIDPLPDGQELEDEAVHAPW
jgi:hypothetical protein